MVVYLLLKGFDFLLGLIISVIPTFDTPDWVSTYLPGVLTRVASFNNYLPVYETIGIVVGLIVFTLSYKIIKVSLNTVHVDLNS